MAQYRELAAFAQFASDLDETTRRQLERGQRVTELMKQKQYSPLSVADIAISLFAADRGYLDDVEVNKIGDFEAALHSFMNSQHKDLMAGINNDPKFSDEIENAFKQALDDFKKNQVW